MKIRRWPAWIALLALLALFPACSPNAGGIAVTVVDDQGTALAAVDLYVDDGATPAASTNTDGEASLTLTGVHDVIVVNPAGGYQTFSALNRDWDQVIALPVTLRQFAPYPLLADATLQFSIYGGVANRNALVTATSRETTVSTTVTLTAAGNFTGGALTVPAGDYYVSAMHADPTAPDPTVLDPIDPSKFKTPSYFGGFFGSYGPVTVAAASTASVTIPMIIGGKEFDPSASGGLTLGGAEIFMGYQVFRNGDQTSLLASNRTAATVATELTAQPMAPPSNATNLSGFSFVTDVVSNTATTTGGSSYKELRRALAFPNQVEMQQYKHDYTLVLKDFGLVTSFPTGSFVGQVPIFYYSIASDQYPQFVEVEISEVVTPGSEYNLAHVVRDYDPHHSTGTATGFYLPAVTGGLSPTGTYRYNILARKLGWKNGSLSSFSESGKKNICFAVPQLTPPDVPSC